MWTVFGELGRHHFEFLLRHNFRLISEVNTAFTGDSTEVGKVNLQQVCLDFTGHPAAEHEGFLHPSGSEKLQGVIDHSSVSQRQQSLTSVRRTVGEISELSKKISLVKMSTLNFKHKQRLVA